jgi:hypothetical protein
VTLVIVPLFKPIRTAGDLPPPGPTTRTQEAHSIDFKNTYSLNNQAEMAKDIAAFANAFGGVILIGTSRDEDPLDYPGISRDFADKLSNAFDDTHAKHLSPKPPIVERHIFPAPHTGQFMLAVNVHPFADQIVGARVNTNVWRFPVRVGAQTNDLEPAMLPLYTSSIRRKIILLASIDPSKDTTKICARYPGNQLDVNPVYLDARIYEIVVPKNLLLAYVTLGTHSAPAMCQIPLDDIDCIWDSGYPNPAIWIIRVLGHFDTSMKRYHSNPSNATIARQ